MTYPYGMKNAPAVGGGLGGLPRRGAVSGGVGSGPRKYFGQTTFRESHLSLEATTSYIDVPAGINLNTVGIKPMLIDPNDNSVGSITSGLHPYSNETFPFLEGATSVILQPSQSTNNYNITVTYDAENNRFEVVNPSTGEDHQIFVSGYNFQYRVILGETGFEDNSPGSKNVSLTNEVIDPQNVFITSLADRVTVEKGTRRFSQFFPVGTGVPFPDAAFDNFNASYKTIFCLVDENTLAYFNRDNDTARATLFEIV